MCDFSIGLQASADAFGGLEYLGSNKNPRRFRNLRERLIDNTGIELQALPFGHRKSFTCLSGASRDAGLFVILHWITLSEKSSLSKGPQSVSNAMMGYGFRLALMFRCHGFCLSSIGA